MPELLLELFSEEIPARMQARASDDLKRLVLGRLEGAGLSPQAARTYVTPRRLTLVVEGVPAAQADLTEERKGPRVGSPDAAVAGFLRGAGLASLDQCVQRDTGKGVFWFAVIETKGRPTEAVLPELIAAAVAELPWPKSMRWGTSTVRWVRPLHSVLALFDGKVLEGAIELGGGMPPVRFGDVTRGHRFLAPAEIRVTGAADYEKRLAEAFVMLDRDARKAEIRAQAERLAAAEGLAVAPDEALLDEVTGLVEWPVAHVGSIDQAFMSVPAEALTTSMRAHQKYFALLRADGSLAPRFVVIANRSTADGGRAVIAGNERVLRARLSDARFFWDQDRRTKLADRGAALANVVFHARLGTVAQKTDRMVELAAWLAGHVPGADVEAVRRAARLAKADLVTGMVGEFPELQGVMGRYYALHDGEPEAVADAVADHYRPLGPGDRCPSAPVSVALALADKLDTLAGFFAIDEKPTGSRDPFALRRAALGVIRLVIENGLRLPLASACRTALALYPDAVREAASGDPVAELMAFFADRLTVSLRERGVRYDLIDAVFARGGEDDLVRLLARVDALGRFLDSEDGANLLAAHRRAANIVRIEEKKDGRAVEGALDTALLASGEERALADALAGVERAAGRRLQAEDFTGCMADLATLRAPVDAFFDRVTVNADDPALRLNRLRLLGRIRAVMGAVADFSRVAEGGRA